MSDWTASKHIYHSFFSVYVIDYPIQESSDIDRVWLSDKIYRAVIRWKVSFGRHSNKDVRYMMHLRAV